MLQFANRVIRIGRRARDRIVSESVGVAQADIKIGGRRVGKTERVGLGLCQQEAAAISRIAGRQRGDGGEVVRGGSARRQRGLHLRIGEAARAAKLALREIAAGQGMAIHLAIAEVNGDCHVGGGEGVLVKTDRGVYRRFDLERVGLARDARIVADVDNEFAAAGRAAERVGRRGGGLVGGAAAENGKLSVASARIRRRRVHRRRIGRAGKPVGDGIGETGSLKRRHQTSSRFSCRPDERRASDFHFPENISNSDATSLYFRYFFSALEMISIIRFFCAGVGSTTTLMVALRVSSAPMKST